MSVTGLVSPFGFDAVQVKIVVPGGCWITKLMLVSVTVGFTPVQLLLGHPAVAPLTVVAAVRVAGLVVNVRFPFLMSLAGIAVTPVSVTDAGFCPGGWVAPAGFVQIAVGFPVAVSVCVVSKFPSPA